MDLCCQESANIFISNWYVGYKGFKCLYIRFKILKMLWCRKKKLLRTWGKLVSSPYPLQNKKKVVAFYI